MAKMKQDTWKRKNGGHSIRFDCSVRALCSSLCYTHHRADVDVLDNRVPYTDTVQLEVLVLKRKESVRTCEHIARYA